MIKKSTIASAIFLMSAIVILAGFQTIVQPDHGWQKLPVTFHIDSRGCDTINDSDHGVTAVVNALTSKAAWNGAYSGMVAAIPSTNQAITGDGIPNIDFHDRSICVGGCIAVTNPTFSASKTIIDADTFINQRRDFTSHSAAGVCGGTSFYMEAIMVHETGHSLGLNHTEKPWATMFPSGVPCMSYMESISADEVKGINYLY